MPPLAARDPPRGGEGDGEGHEHPGVGDGHLQLGRLVLRDDPREHDHEGDEEAGVDPADEMGGEALDPQAALEERERVARIAHLA